MNPGSPAPQAGVLSWLDYGPRQALPGKGLWPEVGLISSIGRFKQEALALYRVLHFFDAREGRSPLCRLRGADGAVGTKRAC